MAEGGEAQQVHPVGEAAIGGADGHLAVAHGVEHQANAGQELVQPVVSHALAGSPLGVAGEDKSRGCVRIHGAMHVVIEIRLDKVIELAEFAVDRGIRLPADTVIYGQPCRHLP